MDNKKRLIIMTSVGVLIFICGVIGLTYAWFSTVLEGEGSPISVIAGKISVKYTDTALITMDSVVEPILDSSASTKAKKNTFTISHNTDATLPVCYKINLVVDSIQTKFKSKYLKWELFNKTTNSSVGNGTFEGVVVEEEKLIKENITLPLNTTHNYEFRIWLSYDSSADQTSLLTNNSGTALSAHLVVSSKNGSC